MSLDVYLLSPVPIIKSGTGVFVRLDGKTVELSPEEVFERFGHHVEIHEQETNQLFHANITHNLGEMAEAAGIYKHLWRPEELGIDLAMFLIPPLTEGYRKLLSEPEKFEELNPPNNWGDYEGLVDFVGRYLLACIAHPEAQIEISR